MCRCHCCICILVMQLPAVHVAGLMRQAPSLPRWNYNICSCSLKLFAGAECAIVPLVVLVDLRCKDVEAARSFGRI
jgi:hypothetical protein